MATATLIRTSSHRISSAPIEGGNQRWLTVTKTTTTQQVLIPVIVDKESIRKYGRIAGMEKYIITKSRVCNRIVDMMLVPGTKEQYDAIMADYSRQFKAEDRDKRYAVPGEDGKLIRCPECNKCSECEYYYKRDNYGTSTFRVLATEGDDGELMEFDPAAPDDYNSSDRYLLMLADFINFASDRDPDFKTMIELLVDGNSRRQVAEQMGLPKSTVIDRVTKLRRLWDEFADNLSY